MKTRKAELTVVEPASETQQQVQTDFYQYIEAFKAACDNKKEESKAPSFPQAYKQYRPVIKDKTVQQTRTALVERLEAIPLEERREIIRDLFDQLSKYGAPDEVLSAHLPYLGSNDFVPAVK